MLQTRNIKKNKELLGIKMTAEIKPNRNSGELKMEKWISFYKSRKFPET